MAATLQLNCWVDGDDDSHVFSVKITSAESVGTLKEVIKEKKKPELDHVAASSLMLWKVSIPVGRRMQQNLSPLELNDENSLSSVDDLDDVFVDTPLQKHLHIVVKPHVVHPPLIAQPDHRNTQLNCLLHGDDISHIFSVDIADSQPVSALKDAIKDKNKPAFDHVPANTLNIYQVSFANDDHLRAKLKRFEPQHDPEHGVRHLSMPVTGLREVFGVPAHNHIHVIVERPSAVHPAHLPLVPILELNCFVHGDDPGHVFPVKIAPAESVGTLKEAIKDKKKVAFEHVDADALQVWKVSIPVKGGVEDGFGKVEFRQEAALSPVDRLSKFFAAQPEEGHLHIVVRSPPATARLQRSHPPSAFKPLPDEVTQARQKRNQRAAYKAPSNGGIPKEFESLQHGDDGPVFSFHRPSSAAPKIPITLLHPVFAQFVDDCENHTPTADDNKLVSSLSTEMSEFFKKEQARASKFREILMKYGIELAASEIEGSSCTTDGDMRWRGLCYLILEAKNELGGGGAEPLFEAILYYLKSMYKLSERDARARLPCLVMYLSGAHIGFAGAVYTDGPNVEVLSVTLPLCVPDSDVKLRTLAARHFGALKKAVQSFPQYYAQELDGCESSLPDARYPFHSSYTPLDASAECCFEYLSQIPNKLVFYAKTETNDDICVKFARQYSMEAHLVCCSLGFAPQLRGCQRVPGGWYMIVMDAIGDEFDYFDKPNAAHYEPLKEKLVDLHQKGYVHGDVRDTNLMFRKDGKPGFMLFDFDWAGVIGDVTYPINVNRGPGLERPDGAYDGELITAVHDIEMLKIMFKSVLPGS